MFSLLLLFSSPLLVGQVSTPTTVVVLRPTKRFVIDFKRRFVILCTFKRALLPFIYERTTDSRGMVFGGSGRSSLSISILFAFNN